LFLWQRFSDVIHRHITAAGLRYRYPRKPWLYRREVLFVERDLRHGDVGPHYMLKIDSNFYLPGYNAVYSGESLSTFRRNMVPPS
jgi:hypothetical protein